MKQYITASSLTDEFLKYYVSLDDIGQDAYKLNKVYEILDKYGDDTEPVDKVFVRATPEDQKKMVDIIRPIIRDGSHEIYEDAVSGSTKGTIYGQGVIDTFNQLLEDGYLDESEW